MAIADIRSAVVTVLRSVTISSPTSMQLKRVYEMPPETLQEFPCAVLYPAGAQRERDGTRRTAWTLRWHVVAIDQRTFSAAQILEAFAEAILDAFDNAVTLHQAAWIISGPTIEVGTALQWGAQLYPAQRYELVVRDWAAVGFAP